jgi:hypothetical protein
VKPDGDQVLSHAGISGAMANSCSHLLSRRIFAHLVINLPSGCATAARGALSFKGNGDGTVIGSSYDPSSVSFCNQVLGERRKLAHEENVTVASECDLLRESSRCRSDDRPIISLALQYHW